MQSTFTEMKEIVLTLIEEYGLTKLTQLNFSSEGNLTNCRIKHPDGRVIRFIGTENKQKINGSAFEKGATLNILFDEPLESVEDKKRFTGDLITLKE
jgi:hypothetical protein